MNVDRFPRDERRPPTEHYQIGQVIGGHLEVLEAASGGMGRVYLCYDQDQDYFYALKTFRFREQTLRNPSALARLKGEVDVWIGLGEHDHVVQCYGLEYHNGLPFIVLEWVEDTDLLCSYYRERHQGGSTFLDWYARLGWRGLRLRRDAAAGNSTRNGTSLESWIARSRGLGLEMSLRIGQEICAGLAYAQRIRPGLVHRDLKPSNILLDEQRRAKVTDFGLAVVIQEQVEQGLSGGTPGYMAPEQWSRGPLDARTDVYAVGCILYDMLTGTLPITSASRLHDQPPVWGRPRLPAEFPRELDILLLQCLEEDPIDRPPSCAELGGRLGELAERMLGKAAKVKPASATPTVEQLNREAYTYFELGKYDLALQRFDEASRLDSSYPNTYNNRGCLLYTRGDYAAAVRDFGSAIRLGSRSINAAPFNNRALVYLALGQPQRALTDLSRAVGENDYANTYANAYVNRGVAYTQMGQYPQALADYSAALEIDPAHVAARHNRAYVYQQLGRLEEALADYDEALGMDPAFLPARINRMLLHRQLGNEADADADWERILQLAPAPPPHVSPVMQLLKPDPQFARPDNLDYLVQQPFEQHAVLKRGMAESFGWQPKSTWHMPPQSTVRVLSAAYSDVLHESVLRRQASGERIMQLSMTVKFLSSPAHNLLGESPETIECEVVIDNEAIHQLEAAGIHSIDDLSHSWLGLEPVNVVDPSQPLRIWNAQ